MSFTDKYFNPKSCDVLYYHQPMHKFFPNAVRQRLIRLQPFFLHQKPKSFYNCFVFLQMILVLQCVQFSPKIIFKKRRRHFFAGFQSHFETLRSNEKYVANLLRILIFRRCLCSSVWFSILLLLLCIYLDTILYKYKKNLQKYDLNEGNKFAGALFC